MVVKLSIWELLVYSNLLWSHIFCKMPLFTNFSPQKMLAPHILIFRDDITDFVSKQLKIMAGCEPLVFSTFWWNGLQIFQSTEGHIENVLFIIPQFNFRLWQLTTFRAFFFRQTPEYEQVNWNTLGLSRWNGTCQVTIDVYQFAPLHSSSNIMPSLSKSNCIMVATRK